MSCGTALARACPSCGASAEPGAKFCVECGTPLAGEAAAPTAARSEPAPAQEPLPEERRQVSVLFADLSGYTAVAERMDPEAVKSMLDGALRRLGAEIERYGGTIDKYIGDNVMGLFGAPLAHEDDPERAVRAGLAMQEAMERVNEEIAQSAGIAFLLRVGINTGMVLAGRVGDGYTVIGDTVNVAARLQAAGRPGSVTVGEGTYRATRETVSYEILEPLELKGKAEPVPAWEAVGLRGVAAPSRPAPRTAAPMVGRDEEAALLVSMAERVARESRPHLVTVLGQAGVGKSRLLREANAKVAELESAPVVRTGACPPYGVAISYWALGEVLRQELGIAADAPPEAAWERLSEAVAELGDALGGAEAAERAAVLLARAIGVEPPQQAPGAEGEDPQRMRESLFSAVRALIEAISLRETLVLAFEDIHWADEGMLDLIEHLARWVRGPLLIICLARDELLERRPDWGGGRRNATSLALEPLSDTETERLVTALYGEEREDQGLVSRVAERAGGNPLFAEEIVNRLREEGGDPEALPDSVHSVLAARLDSLEPVERQLLQYASVVGQSFWEGVLASDGEAERDRVARALNSLQDKDLVVASTASSLAGEREWVFKHALIRDVAYEMLPKTIRCRKHFEAGAYIEDRAAERGDPATALVAEHYGRAASLGSEAGLEAEDLRQISAKALEFLEAAGDGAAALYSNREALDHYGSARELGAVVPEDARARIGEKMGDVALRLGRVEQAVDVWEECLAYHRGQEDLERVGDLHRKIGAGLWEVGEREASIDHYQKGIDLLKDGPPCIELVRLYEEAASLYMHTGDNMLAIYASEKALRLAERLGEAAAASRAHGIFGRVFGRIGDPEKARQNLERSVELARGSDKAEAIRALLALGYHLEVSEADYGAAAAAYGEGLDLAVELGDLPSQVELHAALAQLAAYAADWTAVERETAMSGSLAEREGLLGKLASPLVVEGILAWRHGDWEEAESRLRRAHEVADRVGRSEVAFSALFWLSTCLRERGEYGPADTALKRALEICERANLGAQLVEGLRARVANLALAGRAEEASGAAADAAREAERFHSPASAAAAVEAVAAAAEDPGERDAGLLQAREAWESVGRPLDAARCELLRGTLSAASDGERARGALEEAARRFEELGVEPLAERAKELAPSG